MTIPPSFEKINIVDASIDKHNPLYRKIVLLNVLLLTSAFLFFIFGLYYILVQSLYLMGSIELFSVLLILFSLHRLKKTSSVKLTTFIIITAIFSALLALVIFKKSEDFTLIWTIFVPISSILIYGTKKGLWLSASFYSVVFFLSYQGIDVWQNGAWNMGSYTRYVAASSFLTLIIYVFEMSLENAFSALEKIREQEQSYIEQLTKYSITDPLTSLYNRRYLDQAFYKNFQTANKSNSLYVFFILDLDYFKKYNDTYGHKKGDEVLVKISEILTTNMKRDSDCAFRLGGEEFACLIMAKDEANIFNLIEKVRQDIEDTKLITASFGVCIIDEFECENFDEMYKVADKFLYEAKDRGRNQIVGELTRLK